MEERTLNALAKDLYDHIIKEYKDGSYPNNYANIMDGQNHIKSILESHLTGERKEGI